MEVPSCCSSDGILTRHSGQHEWNLLADVNAGADADADVDHGDDADVVAIETRQSWRQPPLHNQDLLAVAGVDADMNAYDGIDVGAEADDGVEWTLAAIPTHR